MSNNAVAAQGVVLKRGDAASPEVFTTVADVTKVDGVGVKLRTTENTDLSSTWVTKTPTILDGGQVVLSLNWIPDNAGHQGLRADLVARTLRNWQIVWTDDSSMTDSFSGYVTSIEPSAGGVEETLTADVTIDVSGAVTQA